MNFSILKTLVKKESKEYARNPATQTMFAVSVGLLILMSLGGSGNLIMTIIMPLTFLGLYIPAFLIAEEKERRTLGALLVSPANVLEILFGKLIISVVVAYLTTLALVVAFHSSEAAFWASALFLLIATFFLCFIGAVIGLISPSQQMVSTLGTVFMMLFMLAELLQPLNPIVSHVARGLPSHHAIQAIVFSKTELSQKVFSYFTACVLFFFVLLVWLRNFVAQAGKQESEKWQWTKIQKFSTAGLVAVMIATSWTFQPEKLKKTETKIVNNELHYSIDLSPSLWSLKELRYGRKYFLEMALKSNKSIAIDLSIDARAMGKNLSTLKEEFEKNISDENDTKLERNDFTEVNQQKYLVRQYQRRGKSYLRYATEHAGYFYTLRISDYEVEVFANKKNQLEKIVNAIRFL